MTTSAFVIGTLPLQRNRTWYEAHINILSIQISYVNDLEPCGKKQFHTSSQSVGDFEDDSDDSRVDNRSSTVKAGRVCAVKL